MKTVINTSAAPAAIGPYSQAIQAGGFVYVSGQLPINPATGTMPEGIEAQTRQSMENIRSILSEAGLGMEHIVKTTVLLQDMSLFMGMNTVYSGFFAGDYPARAAFAVKQLPKDALVEIECVAVAG
ncbi:MAG: RidA family protein [Prevotellaceae bacterium]|jgi:2-iminobutanoate/2-iminopropanoate deaminase|nr:RidA family protein [Prevotellaceae bacterium]